MFWQALAALLKATNRGHCGTEAARLNLPGLCASRSQNWIFWLFLRCSPLGRVFEFIMVCSTVMGRMCESCEQRTMFSSHSRCPVRLYTLALASCVTLGQCLKLSGLGFAFLV